MAILDPKVQAAIEAAKAKKVLVDAAIAARPKPTPTKILTPEELSLGLLQLPSIEETKETDKEKVLIYGDPFTGKTTLAALMSEFYYLLWFDGDNGLSAIKNNIHPDMFKRIIPIRIPANPMHPIFLHTMLRVVTGRQISVCLAHGAASCPVCIKEEDKKATIALNNLPNNWIAVMDNMTQFAFCAISQAIIKANPKEAEPPPDYKLVLDDWGYVKNMVEKFGTYVKDGDYNFICISHGTLAKKENSKEALPQDKMVPIGGSDASSRTFAKNFGHEVYAKLLNNRHAFFSNSTWDGNIQTGSRSNVDIEKQEIPSLLHFFKTSEAKELLKGSFNEWYLTPENKRSSEPPQPKGILNI